MINNINNINSKNINAANQVSNANAKAAEAEVSDFEKILEKAVEEKDEKKLKEACRNFEAIFINMMFKQMKKTVEKANLYGESYAEETFDDMLIDKYSEEISRNNGIGLGDIMYKQLIKSIKK
ncbi:MAG: rod-binding protein [Bacillota bacterium]